MQKNNKEAVKFHLFPAWLETQHLYLCDGEFVFPYVRMKNSPFKDSPLLKTHLLEKYLALFMLLKGYKLQMIQASTSNDKLNQGKNSQGQKQY